MANKIILDYENSILRQSDVDLLYGPHWLNDNLIGFWFEFLQQNELYRDSKVCLISPEVSQFIKLGSSEDAASMIEPLDLQSKSLIILPINDSSSFDSPGGSHWSLLVYCSADKTFYHLDSMFGINFDEACMTAAKLNLSKSKTIALTCARQTNGWDCGIYVCCYAEFVIKNCLLANRSMKSLPELDQNVVKNQRNIMSTTIAQLKK